MADTSPIDEITAALRSAIAGAISDAQAELTSIAEAGGNAAHGGLIGDLNALIGLLTGVGGILGDLFGDVNPAIDAVKTVADAGGGLGGSFGAGYLFGYLGYQLINPLVLPLIHATNTTFSNEIFDAETVAQLVARGLMTQANGYNEASGSGFDNSHLDHLVALAQNRPGLPDLFELYRRQAISESDLNSTLERLGFTPDWLTALPQLVRQLLSPADLALAVLRQDMDLDVATQYAGVLGYLATDFNTLLLNTGEPPGPEQLAEALRRGFIDTPTFVKGIAESRLRPEWVPTLEKLAYSPLSIADTVRAVVENYLTSDEGAAIAQQNGLLPEHWPILVESWGRPLAHLEMRTLVNRGLASRDDFDQAMRESDIKDKYIDWSFEVGQRLIPERLIVTALDHGSITQDEATTRLGWLGYADEDIALLVSLGTAEGRTTKHALTRADIVALYEDGKMPRDQALSRLTSLGFTSDDAESVLEIADLKSAATALRTQERSIEASYKAHHLTDQQASDQLIAAGVDPTQATTLISEWANVRGRATRGLTEAQILKMGEDAIITPEDCLNRLMAYGLSQGDAQLLMQLEGIPVPGVTPAAPSTAATGTGVTGSAGGLQQ